MSLGGSFFSGPEKGTLDYALAKIKTLGISLPESVLATHSWFYRADKVDMNAAILNIASQKNDAPDLVEIIQFMEHLAPQQLFYLRIGVPMSFAKSINEAQSTLFQKLKALGYVDDAMRVLQSSLIQNKEQVEQFETLLTKGKKPSAALSVLLSLSENEAPSELEPPAIKSLAAAAA